MPFARGRRHHAGQPRRDTRKDVTSDMAPTTQESTHEADPGPGPGFGGGGAPPPPPHKRLYRRTDDKVIAGVASGLGDYFNVDPVIVRIAFVLLAIAGGLGILAYGVMWWIVPPTREV